ncbi:stage II sporulation protein M [Candidatus Cyanaurora vandensis]|uniref:stage II sporulation protein M n=2 Tax=Candidatus Cyanaurora vandensis TaxID=2714958 RepID=UPI00257D37FE|nr:stage II sporulation protein M [Candidatus Cyanaurora vandensis]
MNFQRWINYRRPDWQRLEAILNNPQTPDDLRQLGGLYRQVSADLAKAQLHQLGPDLLGYLQGLTLQAHNQVYQPPVVHWPTAVMNYWRELPSQVRVLWPYLLASVGLFGSGMVVGAILYLSDASFIETMLPPQAVAGVREKGKLWTSGSTLALAPLESSALMTNNISVALTAFAGGMLAGLGTTFILFFNGVLLGAAGVFVAEYRLSYPFWAFISAHGVPELTAVWLAGAAGLMLGRALLVPGPYTRRDRLGIEARRAVPLLGLVVVLLIWAGLVEAFISPNDAIPAVFKFGLGLAELSLLVLFGLQGGLPSPPGSNPDG